MQKLHWPVDEYEVRARLFPALLITLPALAAFWILWPTARSVAGIAAGSAIESAVIFWLTKIARDQGKKLEKHLFEKWGGKPTTVVLRWSDPISTCSRKKDIEKPYQQWQGSRSLQKLRSPTTRLGQTKPTNLVFVLYWRNAGGKLIDSSSMRIAIMASCEIFSGSKRRAY